MITPVRATFKGYIMKWDRLLGYALPFLNDILVSSCPPFSEPRGHFFSKKGLFWPPLTSLSTLAFSFLFLWLTLSAQALNPFLIFRSYRRQRIGSSFDTYSRLYSSLSHHRFISEPPLLRLTCFIHISVKKNQTIYLFHTRLGQCGSL